MKTTKCEQVDLLPCWENISAYNLKDRTEASDKKNYQKKKPQMLNSTRMESLNESVKAESTLICLSFCIHAFSTAWMEKDITG